MRLHVAKEWQLANERSFFYAGPMKRAGVAAWKRAAHAELASYSCLTEYLCMLLDLVKAFDRVPHRWLVQNAHLYDFPMLILRVSIAAYLLGRVICVDGVVSSIISATRSITAGSVLATIEMRLLLIRCVDETVYRFPEVVVTLYVDDTSIEGVGPARRIVTEVSEATRFLVNGFLGMGLELSPTKNVCVASRAELANAAANRLPKLRLKIASQARSLGAALVAGKRRSAIILDKRLRDFRARVPLFRKLRKRIGAKRTNVLIQFGGIPTLAFGQFNTGVSTSALHSQRVAVASAGNSISGELDLTLCMMDGRAHGRFDLAYSAHTDPIGHWAEAVWDQWMPSNVLDLLFQGARANIQKARRTWAAVHGPAASCRASLGRLEWIACSAFEWTTDRGMKIDLRRDSPAFVRESVIQSVRRWRWRRIESRHPTLAQGGRGYGAHFLPLATLCYPLKSTEQWSYAHAGALRSAVTNRQWTQVRVCRAAFSKDRCCQLCVAYGLVEAGSSDPKFLGTLTHRLWVCPVLQAFRDANCPGWILSLVNAELSSSFSLPTDKLLLFTRALHKSVEPRLASRPSQETFNWIVPPDTDGVPYGRVYADGSRLFAEHKYFNLLARHGWAFAIVDQNGKIAACASGTTPPWINGIYGAELWALLQGASCASPGSPMHVDCNAVRLGAQQGTKWALSSSRKLARAWIPLANILEDDADLVTWLPAHCNSSAIGIKELSNGRKFDSVDLAGNALVDQCAKFEAKAHSPSSSDFKIVNDATSLVEGIAKWIGLCTHEANHYPAPDIGGSVKFIRDTTIRNSDLAKAKRAFFKLGASAVKRKAPSSSGAACVPASPSTVGVSQSVVDASFRCERVVCSDSFSQAKRPKLSHKQIEVKTNRVFMEYWLAKREQAPQCSPPSVSAADRMAALRARVATRSSGVG